MSDFWKDENMHTLILSMFILIISIIIGHISFKFKETFITGPGGSTISTYAPFKKSFQTNIYQIENDKKNAYNRMFEARIPTFSEHPCHPSCCHDSTALSCSSGCVCVSEEDKALMNYH